MIKAPWIVLVGPTSVGKTGVAEQIALALKTDIIVADSRQVYQEMDIATNKPTAAHQKCIARHLIDVVPPDSPFSAGAYQREAKKVIAQLEREGKPILIEGGTGLYIKALLHGLWEGPARDPKLRQDLYNLEADEGEGTLYQKMKEVDPDSAEKIHFRDLSKIVRALEVFYLTHRPISLFHAEHRFCADVRPAFVMIGLRRERSALYRRVEQSVDRQFEKGLVAETERLLAKGFSPQLSSMRTLGYKQVIAYLSGESTLDMAVALLKRDTRHYAKRQMTWFLADRDITWIDMNEGGSSEETFARITPLLGGIPGHL
jgi:tRNA dimethylallyltransferase